MTEIENPNGNLVVIGFDTNSVRDLGHYLSENGQILTRIDPSDFLAGKFSNQSNFINLVINDYLLRKQINEYLDQHDLCRFSFVHDSAEISGSNLGAGSFVYPLVSLYKGCRVGKDNIIHSHSLLAHNVSTGVGCYFSGRVSVGGSTSIGDYCYFGLDATVYDKIEIVSECFFGARSIIRKNINSGGKYGFGRNNQLIKI